MITKISPSDEAIKDIIKIYNSYPECFEFEIDENFLVFFLREQKFLSFCI